MIHRMQSESESQMSANKSLLGEGLPGKGATPESSQQTPKTQQDSKNKNNYSDDEELPPWRPMKTKLSKTNSPPWSSTKQETTLKCSLGKLEATKKNETPSKVAYVDLCWDDEEGKSVKKRKREINVNPNNTQEDTQTATEEKSKLKKLKQLIKSLDETTRELSKIVANNQNTKKEIKENVSKLRSKCSLLNTQDMWTLINALRIGDPNEDKPEHSSSHIQDGKTSTPYDVCKVDCSTQTETDTVPQNNTRHQLAKLTWKTIPTPSCHSYSMQLTLRK